MKLETVIQRAKRRYWLTKVDHAYEYLKPRALAGSVSDSVAMCLLSLGMVEMVTTEQYVRDYCARHRALELARLTQ